MGDFRSLDVWEKSHRLALDVYRVTAAFPRSEVYGLSAQMRRSCVSIPSNIAEGCGRNSDPELARFLRIAMGSTSELEYQLMLAHDLQFLAAPEYQRLVNDALEVRRMLAKLIHKVRGDGSW